MIYLEFLKYSLSQTNWWWGFFIGGLFFFLVGVAWHTMTQPVQWFWVGIIGVICSIGTWIIKS